jgi:hypothetical protein
MGIAIKYSIFSTLELSVRNFLPIGCLLSNATSEQIAYDVGF